MKNIFGPNRRSIRIKDFDYSHEGMYSITIVSQDRREILGNIREVTMHLSPIGEMVQKAWIDLPRYDPRISLDEFIVMPNHLHGIIVIGLRSDCGRPRGAAPTLTVPDLIDRFKSWTTRQYFDGVKNNGWPVMRQRLWQRGYYEHIARNDDDLNRIREYIRNNPAYWDTDPENSESQPT